MNNITYNNLINYYISNITKTDSCICVYELLKILSIDDKFKKYKFIDNIEYDKKKIHNMLLLITNKNDDDFNSLKKINTQIFTEKNTSMKNNNIRIVYNKIDILDNCKIINDFINKKNIDITNLYSIFTFTDNFNIDIYNNINFKINFNSIIPFTNKKNKFISFCKPEYINYRDEIDYEIFQLEFINNDYKFTCIYPDDIIEFYLFLKKNPSKFIDFHNINKFKKTKIKLTMPLFIIKTQSLFNPCLFSDKHKNNEKIKIDNNIINYVFYSCNLLMGYNKKNINNITNNNNIIFDYMPLNIIKSFIYTISYKNKIIIIGQYL